MQTALTDVYLTRPYILVTQMVVVITHKQDIKKPTKVSHIIRYFGIALLPID